MEHSGGSPRSPFLLILLLVIHTQLAESSSVYPPAPSPSSHAPLGYTPVPAPANLLMVWNPSPSPSPEALAPSLPPPPPSTVAPSPGEVNNDGSVPSSWEPGEGGEDERSGGMNRGQKAGITVAVAVVVAAAAVAIGLVYKKRRENVRRGEYRYSVRRDIL